MAAEEEPMHASHSRSGGPRGAPAAAGALRACAAEALGTALLVLLGALPPAGAEPSALAAGLVVATLVQCFDHISGAMFNPTVVVAAVVARRVAPARGAALLGAQLAGAAAGAALLRAGGAALVARAVTRPAPALGGARAAALEALAGGCLALANCAAWDARNAPHRDSWPLRVGAVVAALTLVAGSQTGASMNPARSLGPALLAGDFTLHWVYWVGPLSGSLLFSALYCALWMQRAPPPPPAPAPPAPRTRGAKPLQSYVL